MKIKLLLSLPVNVQSHFHVYEAESDLPNETLIVLPARNTASEKFEKIAKYSCRRVERASSSWH